MTKKNIWVMGWLVISLMLSLPAVAERPWENSELATEDRIEALLAAMTLEEKAGQLLYNAPGIPRLGIKPYNWWNEALHGVARNGRATVFPQPIGLGAMFDEELVYRVASAISDEARAKFNIAQGMENYSQYAGLTFWSPNVNLFRDPRWGRGMETYGEDPLLTGRLGAAFVRGLQGDDPRHMKAAACAKHYAVHSGPEALRHEFDAVAPPRDFNESYLPAFKALVTEAKVECVMCAYNRVDGVPACGSEPLLDQILRQDWGFKGHVVSDCWAINDFHENHKVSGDAASSAAWALKAGTDVNCGDAYRDMLEALERELVAEADIDRALGRLLRTRMKLGFFDPATAWDELGEEVVEKPAHVALAREAAQKSIVMLKNDGVLPLKQDIRNLYVTGPFAASNDVLLGNYNGLSSDTVSILEGITGKVSAGSTVQYKYGQLPYRANVNPMDWTTGGAKESDATVVVLGISPLLEGEEGAAIVSESLGDRLDLGLPAAQLEFLRKLREGHEKPVIVVLTGGSPIASPEVHELADAVLFAWYPGQQGGNAVADVLFGDVSPSGRLPITFPTSVAQLPPYEDYAMSGRTYKYMNEEPLYPFGYGLSYTEFNYTDLTFSDTTVPDDKPLEVSVAVTNAGTVAGNEVAQLYVTVQDAPFETPRASLIGFQTVSLQPGENRVISFRVQPEQLHVFKEDGSAVNAGGRHLFHVGGVSPGSRGEQLTGTKLLTATLDRN